jgi:hypothetical protein
LLHTKEFFRNFPSGQSESQTKFRTDGKYKRGMKVFNSFVEKGVEKPSLSPARLLESKALILFALFLGNRHRNSFAGIARLE